MMRMFPLAFLSALWCALLPFDSRAGTLSLESAPQNCGVGTEVTAPTPLSAQERIAHSQATSGERDIAWAWLGSTTSRYSHGALGSRQHAGSLQVLARTAHAQLQLQTYSLPLNRVFEDSVPRIVDLDRDGRDEIILIEADAIEGAALLVLGLRKGALVELARGPYAGSSFRWLNPVGVADFDGDGQLDLASVTTPHIGGVLTLPAPQCCRHALNVSHQWEMEDV